MKRLFLSSMFKDVSKLFAAFAHDNLNGNTVTFIPTAATPSNLAFHVTHSKKVLEKLGLHIDELELSTATASEITRKLQNNDSIYVAGGNTFFLLQEMIRTGADVLIKQQIDLGKLYIGESAGAMILAPNIEYGKDMDTPAAAPLLETFDALDVVDFYPLPHYKSFPLRREANKIVAGYKSTVPLIPFRNSQAILVTGTETDLV